MKNTPIESKSQDRILTTTSFGVLSVLALRDHSTYEVAKQMRLSLHYFWPRAESNIYAELKRLVAAGLAKSRQEWNGDRPRKVYSITKAGRASLAGWLSSPSSRHRYESDAVLKVFFGENGRVRDMRASIRAIHQEATAAVRHWNEIADTYEAGEGAYPGRFGITALVAKLVGEQQAVTARWAAWAEKIASRWDDSAAADVRWGITTIRSIGDGFESAAPVEGQSELETGSWTGPRTRGSRKRQRR